MSNSTVKFSSSDANVFNFHCEPHGKVSHAHNTLFAKYPETRSAWFLKSIQLQTTATFDLVDILTIDFDDHGSDYCILS